MVNSNGSLNVALGFAAGVNLATGNNNIDVGNVGVAAESNAIRIGAQIVVTDQFGVLHPAHTATYIAGIRDTTTGIADAVPVVIDSAGQLGTMNSSRCFKSEIKPMDKDIEPVLALMPVTFHYKSDNKGTPQFGLIAEQVAKVNPDLVVRDRDGEIYSVRYEAVNAMLLNEFLKQHQTVQELKKQVAELSAGLQVSAQLELNRPAPQTALNNQ